MVCNLMSLPVRLKGLVYCEYPENVVVLTLPGACLNRSSGGLRHGLIEQIDASGDLRMR
jgi:hypothetical protein